MNITGLLIKHQYKYAAFKRKRCNVNPQRGPIHERAPSRIFWRTVRGMIPHKTPRGMAALARLKVFEGVPPPYDQMQRKVVPEALRVLRLKPTRDYCHLGRLAMEVGWKYNDVVQKLELKRKIRSSAYYQKKKAVDRARAKAIVNTKEKLAPVAGELTNFGYKM